VALCQVPAYSGATVEAIREASVTPLERLAYWQDWTKRVSRG
jgi:phage head maturation protease